MKVILFLAKGFVLILYCMLCEADTIAGVPNRGQTSNRMWCWAAATQSLCGYYDKNFTKTIEQVASVYTTNSNKCPPDDSLPLLLPKIVETNGNSVGIDATFKMSKLSWAQMKTEALSKRPFIFVIKWPGGGYHCNVFCGFHPTDTLNLYFMDPGNGKKKWRTWSTINGSSIDGSGSWLGSCIISLTASKVNMENDLVNSTGLGIKSCFYNTQTHCLSLILDNCSEWYITMAVFNMKGAELFGAVTRKRGNNVPLTLPFYGSPGMYLLSLQASNTSGFVLQKSTSIHIQY